MLTELYTFPAYHIPLEPFSSHLNNVNIYKLKPSKHTYPKLVSIENFHNKSSMDLQNTVDRGGEDIQHNDNQPNKTIYGTC